MKCTFKTLLLPRQNVCSKNLFECVDPLVYFVHIINSVWKLRLTNFRLRISSQILIVTAIMCHWYRISCLLFISSYYVSTKWLYFFGQIISLWNIPKRVLTFLSDTKNLLSCKVLIPYFFYKILTKLEKCIFFRERIQNF